jgi:hypothetical protein
MNDKTINISFNKVLVTNGMAWTLFGVAQQEGLLYTREEGDYTGSPPRLRDRQAALSLMVLFDKLVIHEITPNTFRLPDLERDGVLEIVTAPEAITKIAPLKSAWKPTKTDPRRPLPVKLRRDLALVQMYKPLIIDRLMSKASKADSQVARALGVSRRTYYREFLDFATHYALGNRALLHENLIECSLPRNLLNKIKNELFDFQRRGEMLSVANARLIVSLVFANELGQIQELSATGGLGVATRYYTRVDCLSQEMPSGFTIDPSKVPRSFGLVRSILHEEGHFFPEIQNIDHALKLRKNPHLRAFKEQFQEFHIQLARGDRESLEKVRKEVVRAKRAIERTAKWNLGLRWLTYLSLPAGIAESLLTGAPILGTSLAVMSAAGTAHANRVSRQHEWVLFGV